MAVLILIFIIITILLICIYPYIIDYNINNDWVENYKMQRDISKESKVEEGDGKMSKYIWETLEREQLSNWAFDTKEECIEEAKEFDVEDAIVVIEVEPYEPYMTADSFLELLLEETVNEVDVELSPNFDILDDKYKKEKEELEQVINQALHKYIEDTGCTLNAYEITENERVVSLEEKENEN